MLTIWMAWLMLSISYSKKFDLSKSDVNHIIESLDNGIIIDIDMSNQSSYLIFDTYI